MGININGTSVDKVVFNGTEVEKVIYNGTIVYTKGLLQWNQVYIPSADNALNAVLYDSDKQQFVAVGDNGLVCRSIGPSSWLLSRIAGSISYSLNDVIYKNGIYVAVGENATILYSSDAITWNIANVGTASDDLTGVCYLGSKTNGYFIAVGNNGLILTSDETGANWSSSKYGGNYSGIEQLAGFLVAITPTGHIITSRNAVNWTVNGQYSGAYHFYGISIGKDGLLLICGENNSGNGVIAYSEDYGKTWSAPITSGLAEPLNDVAYGNGLYVAVGSSGNTYYSYDAVNWHKNPTVVSSSLNGIAYGDEAFVAVGDGGKGIVAYY